MTDRELVELAAKAAGLRPAEAMWHPRAGCVWVKKVDGIRTENGWNPRIDDGDSRRLQVKLNLGLVPVDEGGWACITWDHDEEVTLAFDFDPNMAVLRAAAEIGRGMP